MNNDVGFYGVMIGFGFSFIILAFACIFDGESPFVGVLMGILGGYTLGMLLASHIHEGR